MNPSLEGKAVVVLSNNDGCIVARSNEAKEMGIRMGQPAFEVRDLIRSGKVTALSGNHDLYRDISLHVHDIFRRYVPRAEDYSIDESFFDMDGIPADHLYAIGQAIVDACKVEAGIPVTVGFAPSKTLAKIASHTAKRKKISCMVGKDASYFTPIMDALPIHELWGMGRRLSKRLYVEGVYTIGDFARRDVGWVRARLGVNGERSWRELHGERCIMLACEERGMQDSISVTRTFPHDVRDYDYLRTRIAIYATSCARRLRSMRAQCGEITVLLRTNRFSNCGEYHRPEANIRLETPVADTTAITEISVRLLDKIFDTTLAYKRGGVVLSSITPFMSHTPSLFAPKHYIDEGESCGAPGVSGHDSLIKLSETIDRINSRMGGDVLHLASRETAGRPGHNDGFSVSFGPARK